MILNVLEVRELAKSFHGAQEYGNHPYIYHLDKVAGIGLAHYHQYFEQWGNSNLDYAPLDVVLSALYLHDTIEDTSASENELLLHVPKSVVNIVVLLTNEPKTEGDWKRRTLENIATDRVAVYCKLCDRLANVSERGKLEKYRKEFPLFQEKLYIPDEYEVLWDKLRFELFEREYHGST